MEEKIFYRIGEVSRLVGVAAHTLRYWEKEFSFLEPKRDRHGRRVYTAKDIAKIKRLKQLLHHEGYRAAAARRQLRARAGARARRPTVPAPAQVLRRLKKISRLLDKLDRETPG